MPSFDPQDLASWTGGSWFNEPKVAIEGLCFDARQIKPGQCFIALKISARDGHEFLEQAARGGAVAAIVENTEPIALPQLKVSNSLVAGAIGTALRSKFSKPVVGNWKLRQNLDQRNAALHTRNRNMQLQGIGTIHGVSTLSA